MITVISVICCWLEVMPMAITGITIDTVVHIPGTCTCYFEAFQFAPKQQIPSLDSLPAGNIRDFEVLKAH